MRELPGYEVGDGNQAARRGQDHRAKARDPEMHQTKKVKQWYFGMRVHGGADVNSGVVERVSVTPANASDIGQHPRLLREDDRAVFGDKGYGSNQYEQYARAAGVLRGVSLNAPPRRSLGGDQRARNRKRSSVRSRVEETFRVMKRQFGYTRIRYRGLEKNVAHASPLTGLTNLHLKRWQLMV